MTTRLAGWLVATIAVGGLAAACAAGEDGGYASASSAVTAQQCPQQFVTGYYAGYYAFHPDYQAPQHVDMTAMTHLVFVHIRPGGGQFGGAPGEIVLGNEAAQTNRGLGPGAPYRTIEEYLIGRAHQVGIKALIMLGGVNENAGFRASLAPSVRPTFITNLVNFMVSRDYDGLEADFEGFLSAEDDALLEAFVAELRTAANAHRRYADRPIIITYPGGLKNLNIDQVTLHDRRMADLVDQYNIMSYGAGWFGEGWTSTTHSPLTGHTSSRPMDIASTIQAFVDAGVSRCKMGMGIGFYGMMYQPPFVGPGEPTDGDLSKWSTNDNLWNFAQLTKNGYLDNGTYVWDAPTQTGYRSYPGGFTAAGSDTTVGYISYEDEAGIAAKGAWAKSEAPDAGAGGTIIWLVNYGTTNGVNNLLLTAVKRAFLDPNATEPGANPNPGELPPLPDEAPPWRVPAEQLSYTKLVTTSWSTGYCAAVTVHNNGSITGVWAIEVPFADRIDSLWQGVYSRTPSSLVISGPTYDPIIHPGQSHTVGYCATLESSPQQEAGPAHVTGTITVINDWGSGWCASAAIVNNGESTAINWTIKLPMPTAGTITGFYNAQYTRSGDELTIWGPTWKLNLGPGESASNVQICASR